MIKTAKIAPSLLAADFTRLGEEVRRVADHVDMLHIDVMDGHFVPNLAIGFPVIESLRNVTDLPFDCHMMTTNADAYLERLAQLGADLVTVHVEVYPDPRPVAARAKELGLRFGIVINPPTPVEAVEPFLEVCDLVLVMSVNPGFGGQPFIPEALPKVEALRKLIDSQGLATDIEIDGGIRLEHATLARDAGADVFVAGSAIFGADDPVAAVTALRQAVDRGAR